MSDTFDNHRPGLNSPAYGAIAITPDDSQPLGQVTRAIYVGGEGDLVVSMPEGETVTLAAVQAGAIYPIRCTHVLQTGTTATGLVGLY